MSDIDGPATTRRALLGGAATSLVATALPVSASAERRETTRSPPAIVLAHGAFTDGSCWSGVISRLQQQGHAVCAVQNPLTSLADDVAATRRVLERQAGPVVLVGHSWGGAVITQAGAARNVAALVYVSALAPDSGETVADLQKNGPPGPAMAAAAPDAHGFLWFDPGRYHAGLASDVPMERARWMAASQQPIATACFDERLTTAAWREKPSFYLLSEEDQALSPVLQRWMADRIGATVRPVRSSHMSLISHADETAALIVRAAQSVGA